MNLVPAHMHINVNSLRGGEKGGGRSPKRGVVGAAQQGSGLSANAI